MLSTFGDYLKHLRKRAGMTQHDLAAATGYSRSLISALEQDARLPDLETLLQTYVPALGLQEEPLLAAQLVELAALARGERPPSSLTRTRVQQVVITTEVEKIGHHLPLPPTEILGREREIDHLCQRLLGHHGRLLTLVGPPGVGKTRLAQAVGAALQRIYKDGACFVSLAAVSDPSLVAVTLLAALKLQDSSSKPPLTRLVEALRRNEMVLVLDNFEQLIAAAPLVAELLAECAGVRLLVTSRERLHLRAEQRYHVPPLELAAAVDLFVQRATAVDASFMLTPDIRPLIETICHRLDRLPLALELCAAQTDLLSLPQLQAHLHEHRLDLLVDGAHDLPPRQRTLRYAIQCSYALLTEGERMLFRSLGIFTGGFAWPELEAVNAWNQGTSDATFLGGFENLPALHALIGKSLVQAQTLPSGEQRFVLLEMIREFAIEQVRAQGEEALLRERHSAAYLQLFRSADSHLRGVDAATCLAASEPEQDNLRAALQWSFDKARYEDAAWLMLATSYFWVLSGYRYEEARWLAKLLPYRQTLATDLRLATLLTFYGAAMGGDEFQPLDPYAREMRQLIEDSSQKSLQATTLYFLGCIAADISQAEADFERSIECARAANEAPALGIEFGAIADRNFVLASALSTYATVSVEQGMVGRAMPLLAESLKFFQIQGDQGGIAECSYTLARLALLQGDLTQAHTLLDEVVTIAVALNQNELLGASLPLLGLVTLYEGNATEARQLLSESLQLCLELKDMGLLARVCAYLAEVALWESELDQAAQWLTQSLTHQANPRSTSMYQVERLWIAARLATAQQQYRRAATLFGLAEQMHGHIRYAYAGPIRDLVNTALTTVRETLGAEVFVEVFTTGQQLSLDEAFATILSPTSVTGILAGPSR